MANVSVGGYVSLFIGVMILALVLNGFFEPVDNAVGNFTAKLTARGYTTASDLIDLGFDFILYSIGLGFMALGVVKIYKDIKRV